MLLWWWCIVGMSWASPEVCNGIDDNGNGSVDEGPVAWGVDADGDGWGSGEGMSWTVSCDRAPTGTVADIDDCNDDHPGVFPGALEQCNGLDDDCDGEIDEDDVCGCPLLVADGVVFLRCDVPMPWLEAEQSCAEDGFTLASIHTAEQQDALLTAWPIPSADRWIGLNDIDEEGVFVWSDGSPADFIIWDVGQPDDGLPLTYAGEDCVEFQAPGTWEDDDCFEAQPFMCSVPCTPIQWFADHDRDGVGDPSESQVACEPPVGFVLSDGDCDDSDADLPALFFADLDGDGVAGTEVAACSGALTADDCDDMDAALALDCDGVVDPPLIDGPPGAVHEPPVPEFGFGCGCGAGVPGSVPAVGLLWVLIVRRRR